MRPILTVIALTLIMLTQPLAAQTPVPVANFGDELEVARSKIDKELRIVLAGELRLTAEEREKFWPIYNDYVEARRKAGDLRVKLIEDYANNYENMTERFADRMLDDFIEYHSELLNARKKYLPKFKRVLPSTKVARLFQVEGKLMAVTDYNLALLIPLVQDANGN